MEHSQGQTCHRKNLCCCSSLWRLDGQPSAALCGRLAVRPCDTRHIPTLCALCSTLHQHARVQMRPEVQALQGTLGQRQWLPTTQAFYTFKSPPSLSLQFPLWVSCYKSPGTAATLVIQTLLGLAVGLHHLLLSSYFGHFWPS